MRVGKLAPSELERLVLGRFTHRRSDVLVHAGLGEDSAVLDFGAEVCVISTDPITGASDGAGRLAVHVSCNDVASNGAEPIGVQIVLLLPDGVEEGTISRLMDEVEDGCKELSIEVLGGHTEITSRVSAPVVVCTAVGRASKDRYVTSSGAQIGDAVVVTKSVGLEGSAILATDWEGTIREAARHRSLPADDAMDDLLERARGLLAQISAVRDGVEAAAFGVTAMHDVTEGGLYGALYEMGRSANVGFCIDAELVPVLLETRFICDCLSLDPLGLISSGTMLITCADGSGLVRHLDSAGISASVIGHVEEGPGRLVSSGQEMGPLPVLKEDELWRFMRLVSCSP